ncbi:MAG: ATP-binding protein [Planctomycetota bacterium]|nr:ATP-binding protein [Planctomycetota bacterium]
MAVSSRHPAASLRRRYLAAFLCVATLIVLDQVMIQPELARLSSDAPVINVSGRQRMLSQKLTKTALVLVRETDPAASLELAQELSEIVELWNRAHLGLQSGDDALGLPGTNPDAVKYAFAELEPSFLAIRDAARRLVEIASAGDPAAAPELERCVTTILVNEPRFLRQMHEIVAIYEEETRRHVSRLERTSWTLAGGILLTMCLLHFVAIRPATRLLERRYIETQEQYQAVVESINEGLLLLDSNGTLRFANRQFATLIGAEPEELTGRSLGSLFRWIEGFDRPEGGPWNPGATRNSDFAANEPVHELRLICQDGPDRICWVSLRRLTEDRRQGWVVLLMDVTQQRNAERRALAVADQLAHADRLRSMGEIAAGLAHEVHQPLGAIANYAEGGLARIAAGSTGVEDLAEPLRKILAAAMRAGGIIRRVRRYSQNQPHDLAASDLNSLIQEIVELSGIEMRQRGIRHDLCLGAGPLTIECDAIQIGQVLMNLIQNSIRALESVDSEQRLIGVTTELTDPQSVQLTVWDNGPGIPEAMIEHMFERFSTTRPDGLGLGLAIVHSIVAAHGGEVFAENSRSGGARFTVRLPRVQVRNSRSNPSPESVHVAAS